MAGTRSPRPRSLSRLRGASLVEQLILIACIALAVLSGGYWFGQQVDGKARQQAACVASLDCSGGDRSSAEAAHAAGLPGASVDDTPGAEAEGKTWWQQGLDIGKGFGLQAWDTVTGLIDLGIQLVTDPVPLGQALWHAVTHPIETISAAWDALLSAWNDNPEELIGRGIFELVTLPLSVAKIAKIAKLKFAGAARLARGAEVADDAGAVAKTVDKAADTAKLAKAAALTQKEFAAFTDVANPRVAVYQESVRRAASLEALAEARYGAEAGMASLNKIRAALGPGYDVLVSDPGVVMRLDDFLAFSAKQDLKALKPWELRELYSQHLGTAKVYRGLALTEEQAKSVQKEGMLSGYLRPDATGNLEWSKGDPFSQNVYSMMKERIHGQGWGPISAAPDQAIMDGLMSVTFKEDVAALVTGGMVKQIGRADVKMYIYRVDIPELDLLPGPVFDRFPGHVNKDELFVPFRIKPGEVVSMDGPLEPRMIDLGRDP